MELHARKIHPAPPAGSAARRRSSATRRAQDDAGDRHDDHRRRDRSARAHRLRPRRPRPARRRSGGSRMSRWTSRGARMDEEVRVGPESSEAAKDDQVRERDPPARRDRRDVKAGEIAVRQRRRAPGSETRPPSASPSRAPSTSAAVAGARSSEPITQLRLAPSSDSRPRAARAHRRRAPRSRRGPPISTATPARPMSTPSATSGLGAFARRKSQGSRTVHSGPAERISAVSPDGTHCSAQQTVPLPPPSISPPATVAASQARAPGAGAPRSRSTA